MLSRYLVFHPMLRLTGIFIILGSLNACSQTHAPVTSTSRPATRPAASNQVLVDPCAGFDYTGWYFVMPAEQRAKFAADVASLQLGDSRKIVLEALGNPGYQGDAQTNCYLPFGRKHRCWYLAYYVARISDGANIKDQEVSFWFDCHNRLEIIDSNVPGIPTRETPDAMSNEWRFAP